MNKVIDKMIEISEDEQQLAGLVRSTLQAATKPDHGRLAQLRPAIPVRPQTRWGMWQKQGAVICAVLVVCLSLLGVYQLKQGQNGGLFMPTFTAVTATFTSEPTATNPATSTAVAGAPLWVTPLPPTPVAALPSTTFIRNP